jgi:WD40 repeat protein
VFQNNRLPLYLRLLFEQSCTWHSNFKPARPAGDIPGLIRETFAALSTAGKHGAILVERSLAYIAAGKAGLSHEELIEILSGDHQVMSDFRQRSPSSPQTETLPAIIWSRLYLDLAPYFTESLVGGAAVLDFFHRQLREVVEHDYLNSDQKEMRHRALSEYFARQELLVEADGQRSANLRKLTEWPFQLCGAKNWRRLSRVLSAFPFLDAKVSALGAEAVIEDFDLLEYAIDNAPADVDFEALRSLQACLRLASGVLSQDAGQLPAQLHGRLAGKKFPLLQALLKEARSRTSSPWLRPLSESLVSTGEALLTNYVFDREVEVVAISLDAANLLIGCDDGSVRIVNIAQRNEVRRLQIHTATIIAIKPLPGSQSYVSGSRDGNMAVWDDRGKIISRIWAPVNRLYDLDVAQDETVLIAAGQGERDEQLYDRGVISVWTLEDTAEKQQLQIKQGSVNCVALNPLGNILLCGTSHDSIQKWKFGDERPLAETRLTGGAVFKITFLPDGRHALICSGDQSGGRYDLRLWDVDSWKELHIFRGHRYMLTDVTVSAAGDRALSASYDQTACLWDLKRYRLIARLTGHRRRVTSVVVEPDGDIAYSASGNNVYRWSLENAVQSGKSQGHKDLVRKVTASVDGRVGISAADDDTVAVWDLRGSQPALAHRIENRKVQQFCVSSDAQIMFFADDGNTVKRASVRNGSEGTLLTLTNTRVTALLSSENDDMLFIGCDDGQASH